MSFEVRLSLACGLDERADPYDLSEADCLAGSCRKHW